MRLPARLFSALTTVLMLSFCAAGVSGQIHPPMAEQRRDAEKEAYYARFSDLKRMPSADHQRRAYEAAQEYLKRFEGDRDADAQTVRKFVNEYEKQSRDYQVYAAFTAKNYLKTFELGRKILETQPENFFVLATLAQAGYENSLAGDPSLNAETIGYARNATQALDSGKVTKAEPFKSLELARGSLNAELGTLLKDQSPVEAAAAFRKAVQTEGPFRTDGLVHYRLGVAILKGEFAQLSDEYNQKYGSKQSSPEQQALLDRIQNLGQRAVDAYARAVALSTKPELQQFRTRVLEQLTALYKSLHNNSEAGLNEFVGAVLLKPVP